MEALHLRVLVKPFRMKKLNRRLTALLKDSIEHAPVAPVAQLKREADAFEKMMLERRNSIK